MNLFVHLVGLLGRGIGPTQGRYLHSIAQHREGGHKSMTRAGFEHTIPVFERSETVGASDRAAMICNVRTDCYLSSHIDNFTRVYPKVFGLSL
jgi:hypothetical protein